MLSPGSFLTSSENFQGGSSGSLSAFLQPHSARMAMEASRVISPPSFLSPSILWWLARSRITGPWCDCHHQKSVQSLRNSCSPIHPFVSWLIMKKFPPHLPFPFIPHEYFFFIHQSLTPYLPPSQPRLLIVHPHCSPFLDPPPPIVSMCDHPTTKTKLHYSHSNPHPLIQQPR